MVAKKMSISKYLSIFVIVGLEDLEDIGNDNVDSYAPFGDDSELDFYLNGIEGGINTDIDGLANTNQLGLDRRGKRLTVDFNGIQGR